MPIVVPFVSHRNFSIAALAVAIVAMPFSITVCHAGIIAFLLLWISEGKWKTKFTKVKESVLVQVLLMFSVFQCAGIIYTEDFSAGLTVIEKKVFLTFLPVAVATSSLKLSASEITKLIWTFTGACLIGSLVCLSTALYHSILLKDGISAGINFDYLNTSVYKSLNPTFSDHWLLFSYITLADGIRIHPAYFSLYISFCIVFLVTQIRLPYSTRGSFMLIALILYFSVFVMLLSTRIAIISLLVLFVFFIVSQLNRGYRLVPLAIFLVSAFTVSFLFINPVSRYRNLQELAATTWEVNPHSVYSKSTEIRASLWWIAVKSLNQTNVLYGAGMGDVESVMKKTSEAYQISNILESYDPHNQYLFTLLGSGVSGLLLLMMCLGIPFYLACVRGDLLCGAFIFLIASICFTESALELQKGIVFLSVFYPLLIFQLRSYHTVLTPQQLNAFARS